MLASEVKKNVYVLTSSAFFPCTHLLLWNMVIPSQLPYGSLSHICLCGNGYFYINCRTFLVSVCSNSKYIVQAQNQCFNSISTTQILLGFHKDTHLLGTPQTNPHSLLSFSLKFCLSLLHWWGKPFIALEFVITTTFTRRGLRHSPKSSRDWVGVVYKQHRGGKAWTPDWPSKSVLSLTFWRITQLLRKEPSNSKKNHVEGASHETNGKTTEGDLNRAPGMGWSRQQWNTKQHALP